MKFFLGLFVFLYFSTCLSAQDILPERPFPITMNVKQVIVLDSLFSLDNVNRTSAEDTSSIMYFSLKGDAIVEYIYNENKPNQQNLFEYDSKHNLIHKTNRRTDCSNTSIPLNFDTLQTCHELKFEYSNRSRVTKSQWIQNNELIEETEYTYDKSNKLMQSINKHVNTSTSMKFVFIDSTTYRYSNDTIFKEVYYTDKTVSTSSVEHFENGHITMSYEILPKGKKDFETISTYNLSGSLIDEKFNNSLPLYSGNILLRTNHVKYEYDNSNRLARKIFLVNDKPYRVQRYIYQ